jgi:hypothetical protein
MGPMFNEFSSERNHVSRLYISGSPPKVEVRMSQKGPIPSSEAYFVVTLRTA